MSNESLYINYANINESIQVDFSKSYYDKTASEYDSMYREYMPLERNARILDIGCGKGFFLYYLKQQGYTNFYGIDADQSSIDFSRANVTSECNQAFAEKFLSDKVNYYDLVVMNEVLEHIPKDEIIPLLSIIRNSMRTGAKLICYVPNMENPFSAYTRYHDFTHTIGFTQNSLRMVLNASGFGNVEIGYPKSSKKGIKQFFKKQITKKFRIFLSLLFEYPTNGIIHTSRIYSVVIK